MDHFFRLSFFEGVWGGTTLITRHIFPPQVFFDSLPMTPNLSKSWSADAIFEQHDLLMLYLNHMICWCYIWTAWSADATFEQRDLLMLYLNSMICWCYIWTAWSADAIFEQARKICKCFTLQIIHPVQVVSHIYFLIIGGDGNLWKFYWKYSVYSDHIKTHRLQYKSYQNFKNFVSWTSRLQYQDTLYKTIII